MAATNDAALDPEAALTSLAYGCAAEAELVSSVRGLPASLLHCQLVFAPARSLEPLIERREARGKGRFIAVALTDAPNLGWWWVAATRKVPEVEAALCGLDVR